MTTPAQMRVVLSEIPEQFEQLRMNITPTLQGRRRTVDAAISTVFNATTVADNAHNVAIHRDTMQSSNLSPDELIIRQRGLKTKGTDTPEISPSVHNIFQRTPTKNPLLTIGMILRSSPRKRLTMGSTPPDPTPPAFNSPTKPLARQRLWPSKQIAKRLKLGTDERPLAQISMEKPLGTILQGLSQEQLIDIIVNNVVDGDHNIEEKLRSQIPTADIEPLEKELQHLKRNIYRSLPTSRLCKKTDSTAYSKASVHLAELKRVLTIHAQQLHDSTHWDALLDYVTMAWPLVRSTPVWESVAHNNVRRGCFKILAYYCIAAIKNGGLRLGSKRLNTLEEKIRDWSKDYEEINSCMSHVKKILTNTRHSL